MDKQTKTLLLSLASRLAAVDPAKLARVVDQLQQIVEGREVIARYDHQIFLRPGRPTKRYLA